jgi:hypothetical protein
MAEQKRVYFSKIERRNGNFFAQIKDMSTDELVVAARLDYVLQAIEAGNYAVVNAGEVKAGYELSDMSWAAGPGQGGI